MIDLSADVQMKEVRSYIQKLPKTMFETIKKNYGIALANADATTKNNATNKLRVRSGALKRSIKFELKGESLKTMDAVLYTQHISMGQPVVYAPIQEYGGVVKAKNAYKRVPGGPYLNIPADANKTPAGVMRMNARTVFNQGGYIAGKVVYLNGLAMFYLVKQVTIPPRLGMIKAAEDEVPGLLSRLQAQI